MAMKNTTQLPKKQNPCSHCLKTCDYVTYDKKITKEAYLDREELGYKHYFDHHGNDNYEGMDEFVSYFMDRNDTLVDKKTKDLLAGEYQKKRSNMYKMFVVVHLRFMKPEIDWIDTKYTVMDKFANFGGNFGIFAEITGCSFLGILNSI